MDGGRRFAATDDAYVAGDLTPMGAKVSGRILHVGIQDYQSVRRGDLLAGIDPSDYEAQLAQARANEASASATLSNIRNQRAIQRALIRQAEATRTGTAADLERDHLEAVRQRTLKDSGLAGTLRTVEQTDAAEKHTAAQLDLNDAAVDQQRALLDSLDIQEQQLMAQLAAAGAARQLAENNLRDTEIRSPVDGMTGQRQVRDGQFVNVGGQVVSVMALPDIWVIANYKETQMTNVRIGLPARIRVDAFPDVALTGHVDSWSPGTGSTFALLAPDNATGNFTKVVQRVPVKVALDPSPVLGELVRPGMSVVVTIDTGEHEAATSGQAAR